MSSPVDDDPRAPRLPAALAWLRRDPVRLAVASLALASLLAVALVYLRSGYTGKRSYNFLAWNLFLAWVPVGFALATRWAAGLRRRGRRWVALLLGLGWVAFFPNAPYILTDLMHLRTTFGGPLWVDLLMVSVSAWTGLMLGLLSLRIMHRQVAAATRPAVGWLFAGAMTLACGYGVYLGRFQRWNSWDLLTRPGDLLDDALSSLIGLRPFTFALVFGLFVFCAYLTVVALGARRQA